MNTLFKEAVSPTLPLHGSFSGHETFTFRYAWLKKGLDDATRANTTCAFVGLMLYKAPSENLSK